MSRVRVPSIPPLINSGMAATNFIVKDEKKVSVQAAEVTTMQEKATAFILKQAYKNNVSYKTVEDIVKHKETKKYLQSIFVKDKLQLLSYTTPVDIKSPGGSYLNNFFLQHKKMLSEYANPGWTLFDRDDKNGFMNYITNLVKVKFGIAKKDAWNPADIWLIKSPNGQVPSNYRQQIDEAMNGNKGGATQTLEELNVIMRAMFKAEQVVGISLKKISGSQAKYEKINADEKFFKNIEKQNGEYSYSFLGSQTKLGIVYKNKKPEFENVNTMIYIADSTGQQRFTIQMQGNTTSRESNLSFDAKDLKSGAALIGKVPLDPLQKLAELTKGIPNETFNATTRSRDHLARTLKEFETGVTKYKAMFSKVKKDANGNPNKKSESPVGDCKDEKEFVKNMKIAFESNDKRTLGAANNKLLQLYFMSKFLSAKDKTARNRFVTDMIFLAAKQGRSITSFGVFGKLY
jgi:hypothetical protein